MAMNSSRNMNGYKEANNIRTVQGLLDSKVKKDSFNILFTVTDIFLSSSISY